MHGYKKLVAALIAVTCMLFSVICVLAASSESIDVRIPVTNQGHAGTVGLFDKTGEKLLDSKPMGAGESGGFDMTIDTLGKKSFLIQMLDEDTDEYKYDPTVYEADVYVEYNMRGNLTYAVIIQKKGEDNKVSEGVIFEQMKDQQQEPGTPDPPPDAEQPTTAEPDKDQPRLPQTGTLRWVVPYLLAVGIVLTLAGAFFLRAGRNEE